MIYTATLKKNPYNRICGWFGLDIVRLTTTVERNEENNGNVCHCILMTNTDNPDPELIKAMGEGWTKMETI